MVELLATLLGFVAGILATVAVVLPKALELLKAVEAQTPEGTEIDTKLDQVIKIAEIIGKLPLLSMAQQARQISDSMKRKGSGDSG